MSNFFNKSQIDKITDFAYAAGKIAAESFTKKDFSVERKKDGSRVTSADVAVSRFLNEQLTKEFPSVPIICEEGSLRDISGDIFFLIDPIDGTSSFAKDNVEFCINIALVKDKKPIFGLIYAPLFEDGKMVFNNEKNQVILRDNSGRSKVLKPYQDSKVTQLRIVTSPRSEVLDIENFMSKNYPKFAQNFTVERLSSAIKFFRVLEGDVDLYLHFRPSMEWDIASGQALVEALGGKVKCTAGCLTYKKINFENPPFTAMLADL